MRQGSHHHIVLLPPPARALRTRRQALHRRRPPPGAGERRQRWYSTSENVRLAWYAARDRDRRPALGATYTTPRRSSLRGLLPAGRPASEAQHIASSLSDWAERREDRLASRRWAAVAAVADRGGGGISRALAVGVIDRGEQRAWGDAASREDRRGAGRGGAQHGWGRWEVDGQGGHGGARIPPVRARTAGRLSTVRFDTRR